MVGDRSSSNITAKKKLAILSNTSSPSHVALTRLPKYGLNENMFAGGLVSSGEECAKFVRETYCNNNHGNNYCKKALWFTWEESETQNPLEFLSHCSRSSSSGDDEQGNKSGMNSIHVASSVEEADFILLHGSQVWRRFGEQRQTKDQETMIQDLNFLHNQDYTIVDPILEQAAQRNLPMVCANPDFVVGLPGGLVGHMPGE